MRARFVPPLCRIGQKRKILRMVAFLGLAKPILRRGSTSLVQLRQAVVSTAINR